ncbi:hypothetical protein F2P81_012568 [Scophthalmus maximus]|uniref:Uncharacterized protein n=1 Tax=Scophthalmus maximus TaxID=52904 RepID=A0A6A4SSG5_SCOMX|nr:hypothetical protein F2P81_012568 [Scophthalmus maximus]
MLLLVRSWRRAVTDCFQRCVRRAPAHLRYLETVRNVCGKFLSSDGGGGFETKRLPRSCFLFCFRVDSDIYRHCCYGLKPLSVHPPSSP